MELKLWMLKNRWSVRAMAKEIGCNESTLSTVCTGVRIPARLLATAIVNFTNGEVTLSDLGIEKK